MVCNMNPSTLAIQVGTKQMYKISLMEKGIILSCFWQFIVVSTDPNDGDLLPINNDDNFARALQAARPLLRIHIQRRGESQDDDVNQHLASKKNIISSILGTPKTRPHITISYPKEFRQV